MLPKRWECRFSVPKFKNISASIPPDLPSLESVPLTFWDRLTPLLRFLGYFYLHILVSAINLLNLVVFAIIIDIRHCNSRHVRSSAIYGTKDVTSIITLYIVGGILYGGNLVPRAIHSTMAPGSIPSIREIAWVRGCVEVTFSYRLHGAESTSGVRGRLPMKILKFRPFEISFVDFVMSKYLAKNVV